MPVKSDLSNKVDQAIADSMSKKSDFFKANQACLHPFTHSLVNHNFDLLSDKMEKGDEFGKKPLKKEEHNQILSSTLYRLNNRLN